jgi:hypothetical protein
MLLTLATSFDHIASKRGGSGAGGVAACDPQRWAINKIRRIKRILISDTFELGF